MTDYTKVKTISPDEPVAIARAVEIEDGKMSLQKRLRVVAPTDLYANYRLTVRASDGECYDIIVPSAVHQGQEFEADAIKTEPIQGRWSDGLCECFSSGSTLFAAWCCVGLVYAGLMERLKLNWLANPGAYKKTRMIVSILWFSFLGAYISQQVIVQNLAQQANSSSEPPDTTSLFACMVLVYALVVYLIVIQTKTRMAARQKYGIPGDCCTDCLMSYFCACCSALQIHRHMKRSGESSLLQGTIADGEIV